MKNVHYRILFGIFLSAVATVVYSSCDLLPTRAATHFGPGGRGSGFLDRDSYRLLISVLALAVPLVVAFGTGWLGRLLPAGPQLPNRDYWLLPVRRERTLDWIERFGLTVGAFVALFLLALHGQILAANAQKVPMFDMNHGLLMLAGWLGFVSAAVIAWHSHFRKRSDLEAGYTRPHASA